MKAAFVVSILVAVALAGCTDAGDDGPPTETDGEPASSAPMLHGWVFDQALVPLTEATVEILELGIIVDTDGEGYYEFTDALPTAQPIILVARQETFKPTSHSLTLQPNQPVRLNFTLEAEPILVPDQTELNFEGFLNCQYNADVGGSQYFNDCSGGSGGDLWQFAVEPNLAGVVLEIGWTPNTEFSRFLHAKLETQQVSDQTIVLSEHTGSSVLTLQVAEQFARKYYPAGGLMLLSVNVDPNNADQESEIGAAAAVSQDYQVCATLFYVEPPPQGFTRC